MTQGGAEFVDEIETDWMVKLPFFCYRGYLQRRVHVAVMCFSLSDKQRGAWIMSEVRTLIDELLHNVRCQSCSQTIDFTNRSNLSKKLQAGVTLYSDRDLSKGTCPNCGSSKLELTLKSSISVNSPKTSKLKPAKHGRKWTSDGDTTPSLQPRSVSAAPEPNITQNQFPEICTGNTDIVAQHTDLSDDERVDRIRHQACLACAVTAIQPIPFADIFILTPMQGAFASQIAAIRGVKISENDGQEWAKQIISLLGMGFLAQQIAIGIWKTVTWGAGGLLTIPLVYGLTYGVMSTVDAYFKHKAKGIELPDHELRALFKSSMKIGKQEAQKNEASLKRRAKEQANS